MPYEQGKIVKLTEKTLTNDQINSIIIMQELQNLMLSVTTIDL